MKVSYEEKEGKLHYEYRDQHKETGFATVITGIVPAEVCKKGLSAVRSYAELAIEEEIKRKRPETEASIAFMKNPGVYISCFHGGVILEGRVIFATSRFIRVRLESPTSFRGEDVINFGFASAMAGHFIFDKDSDHLVLSQAAIEAAQRVLTWIYNKKKHRKDHGTVIDLAKNLNR